MTKKNLERRNNFLLLQLKLINKTIERILKEEINNREKTIFELKFIEDLTEAEKIKKKIELIEFYDCEYNIHDKNIDITEYSN